MCCSRLFRQTKEGLFITGKSKRVVTPPDAAALVPKRNPSHFSLDKSYKFTLQSIIPGIMIRSPKSQMEGEPLT